ncbi:factor of DNA methylation 2-like protein, partial [Tanacetum coccineum]
DETKFSNADVEAFTAALSRDIQGNNTITATAVVELTLRVTINNGRRREVKYRQSQEVLVDIPERITEHGLSSKITQSSGGSSDMSEGSEYSGSFEDYGSSGEEIVDEDDSHLKELKSQWGEEACKVAVNALLELHEYNPSGRYLVSKLWNFKERRKATLKEVVNCFINQLKAMKSLKRRRDGQHIE